MKTPQDLTLVSQLGEDIKNSSVNVEKVLALDWFEPEYRFNRGYIFVSASEIEKILDGLFDAVSPEDCEIVTGGFVKVDDCLKRYNPEDGFYHA